MRLILISSCCRVIFAQMTASPLSRFEKKNQPIPIYRELVIYIQQLYRESTKEIHTSDNNKIMYLLLISSCVVVFDSSDDIKPCPRCSAFIIKMDDGSCNHMTCAVCGAEFCWLCMKEISDLHYLR